MMRRFIVFGLLMFSLNAAAIESAVDITSDMLDVMQDKGYAVFTKNVMVQHDGMEMVSDLLEVYFISDQDDKINDAIKGAIQKIEATGNVAIKFSEEGQTASGKKAVYSPKTQTVTLTEDVSLVRGENVLTGSSLIYDLKTKQFSLKAGKNEDGRIKAHIEPEPAK